MRKEICNNIIIHHSLSGYILMRRFLHFVHYDNYQHDILKADMSLQAHMEACGCKTKVYLFAIFF
jgi:hypothetical protein